MNVKVNNIAHMLRGCEFLTHVLSMFWLRAGSVFPEKLIFSLKGSKHWLSAYSSCQKQARESRKAACRIKHLLRPRLHLLDFQTSRVLDGPTSSLVIIQAHLASRETLFWHFEEISKTHLVNFSPLFQARLFSIFLSLFLSRIMPDCMLIITGSGNARNLE